MISPAPGAAANDVTYTTIPISGTDVITRSIQNLSTSFSRCRPWPEFFSAAAISLPSSLSAALRRLGVNSKYFHVNYAVVASVCGGASLLSSPAALLAAAIVFAAWLVLFFCREDPMVVMGRNVDDRAVTVGLVLGSLAICWAMGGKALTNLLVGFLIGLFIAVCHGVFRKTEGLYLDENDSVYTGLVSASPNGAIF